MTLNISHTHSDSRQKPHAGALEPPPPSAGGCTQRAKIPALLSLGETSSLPGVSLWRSQRLHVWESGVAGPGSGATSRAPRPGLVPDIRVRPSEMGPLRQQAGHAPWPRFWFSGADRSTFLRRGQLRHHQSWWNHQLSARASACGSWGRHEGRKRPLRQVLAAPSPLAASPSPLPYPRLASSTRPRLPPPRCSPHSLTQQGSVPSGC